MGYIIRLIVRLFQSLFSKSSEQPPELSSGYPQQNYQNQPQGFGQQQQQSYGQQQQPYGQPSPFGAPAQQPFGNQPQAFGAPVQQQAFAPMQQPIMQQPLQESPIQREWRELQDLIRSVETNQYDLLGLHPNDPAGYWQRINAIDDMQAQGASFEQAIAQFGYPNRDYHDLIHGYIQAKWSRLSKNDDGEDAVVLDNEFMNAMMQSRMQQTHQAMAQAAAADPNLLAPVEGVTLEQWAQAAVALGSLGANASPQQAAEALARFGLDQARYDRAQAGWTAKMQNDTSFVIAQKYGEAFSAAQGQVGGFSMQPGQTPGGSNEPCSFELFVEIMTAQSAWAEQGIDVNVQMPAVFGVDIMTFSKYSSYWSPKMGSDYSLYEKFNKLEQQYQKKYGGASMDDDLSL